MELSGGAKDTFETFDDEISDQEATESVDDRSVCSTPVWSKKSKSKTIWLSLTKNWNIAKPVDQILIWTNWKLPMKLLTNSMSKNLNQIHGRRLTRLKTSEMTLLWYTMESFYDDKTRL